MRSQPIFIPETFEILAKPLEERILHFPGPFSKVPSTMYSVCTKEMEGHAPYGPGQAVYFDIQRKPKHHWGFSVKVRVDDDPVGNNKS